MLGTTLQKIEETLGEIAEAVSKHSTLMLLTKMKTFPKITLNPDMNEAIHYATDELIRCQRALNNARRHLTNLGITPDQVQVPTASHPTTSSEQIANILPKHSSHNPEITKYPSKSSGTALLQTLTPGHGSETTTKSPQSNESSVRQPIRTDVPRVLGKPIGLPDNLSSHSEG